MRRNLACRWVLAGALLFTASLSAQDRYADPAGRFALSIPPGWEATSTDPDAITVTNGPAQVTVLVPRTGEARLMLDQFVEQYQSQWSDWNLGRRDSTTVAGLDGQAVMATGRSPRGVFSVLRIATAAASTGPVVVISSAPQEGYNGLRPTLESIEGSIVLGARIRTVPPTGSAADAQVARAFLGVGTRAVEATDARVPGLQGTNGAFVGQLYPGGPAEDAGIATGDVIVALDGTTIDSPRALTEAVARHHAGDAVILSVIRQGRRGDLRVVLRAPPER